MNSFFAIAVLSITALTACSTTKKVEPSPVQPQSQNPSQSTNNSVALQNDASYYTELHFDKGSSKLDHQDFTAIDDLIKKSLEKGDVKEVKVISWADREYPKRHHKSLSKREQSLAEHRNDQIKDYIKRTYPSVNISVFNMAKRANGFQEFFSTTDAKTKETIEKVGLTYDEHHHLRAPNKSSTALILSVHK